MRKRYLAMLATTCLGAVMLLSACAPHTTPPPAESSPSPEDELSSSPTVSVEEPIHWDIQSVWPAGFLCHELCAKVFQKMEDASGGRLDITYHPAGAIVPANEALDAVDSGALDGCTTAICTQFGKNPAAMFFDKYPAGPNTYELYVWLYEDGGLDLWQELYDRIGYNVHVVGPMGSNTAENFGWFDKPIKSLDDFKGLKFRTQGVWGDILTSLGTSVVTMPGGEVYEAAQRGVIDAFEFATPAVDYSAGFYEIRKVLMEPGIHAPTSLDDLTINQDRWDELPDDLKAIVEMGAQAGALSRLAATDYADILAMDALQDKGVVVETLPDEVIEQIIVVANQKWDEIAKEDPFFAKCLESQREFLRKFRAMHKVKEPDPYMLDWPR